MKTTTKFKILGLLKGGYFYLPIFTLYATDHGITMSVVVFSQAFYSVSQFLFEVPTGVLADRFGQKTSVLIGYTLEALGILTVVLWPTTLGLYACYAIGGLAASFLSGSEEVILFEACKKEKTKYAQVYGAFLSNITFGMMLSALLGGFAFALFDRAAFVPLLVATTLALLLAAILATTFKMPAKAFKPGSKEAKLAAESGGSVAILKKSLALMREDDTLWHLMIVGALTLTGDYFLYSVYQPAFLAVLVPAIWFGAALSIGSVVNMILIRYVYVFERYLTLDKIILFVNLFIALGYLGMSSTGSPFLMLVAFIAAQSLFGLETPVVSDYINERTTPDVRSTVLSGISFTNRFVNVFLRAGLALVVGLAGIKLGLFAQGCYLFVGVLFGYYLLVKCGCIHRITMHDGKAV